MILDRCFNYSSPKAHIGHVGGVEAEEDADEGVEDCHEEERELGQEGCEEDALRIERLYAIAHASNVQITWEGSGRRGNYDGEECLKQSMFYFDN
jgi:hypothetical protein